MAHDDMVQYPGTDYIESVLEGGGQSAISLAGLWVAGGMVVDQDYGRCIVFQGDLDHFSRVHTSSIQRTSE